MDLLNTEIVSIKTESVPQEEVEGEKPYTDVRISFPDVKKECLQFAETSPIASSFNVETLTIKAEPEPREEDGELISYLEIDVDLKNECSEYCEITTQTTDESDHMTKERLPIRGHTFEEHVESFTSYCATTVGLQVMQWSHVSYLCEGDFNQSYWLNDSS